jgi:hypothetical protein
LGRAKRVKAGHNAFANGDKLTALSIKTGSFFEAVGLSTDVFPTAVLVLGECLKSKFRTNIHVNASPDQFRSNR